MLFFVCSSSAADSVPPVPAEETLLMFVGEIEPVVTVASRYPESPTTAPAMVNVVSREQIELNGYRTLAELLADQPGFYMATGGRGTVPYLRGLRDSILFLYDGVPMTTDVTKNFTTLDRELSLVAVERVEIIRGPGSVLWGPDAFAGVVNIVPRRGRRQSGIEARIEAGNHDLSGGSLTLGHSQQTWDAFLAFSGVRETFHDPDYSVDQDRSGTVNSSPYKEVVGTMNIGNWLHLSGRWSDFKRKYTMQSGSGGISWSGEKETPVKFLKATINKVYGASHYSLIGFIQKTDFKVQDAGIKRKQDNQVLHLELLWDRRIFSRGLLVAGVSWRRNNVDGALVRDGFLPDLLPPDDDLFIPQIKQEDFTNNLISAYSQFRYRWGKSEYWAGLRMDDHSQYQNTMSYSFGFYRPLDDHLSFKAAYGTAFRSPYPSQLFNQQHFDPESVRTGSAQLLWDDGSGRQLELTLFYSRLSDSRVEDPYGGLSLTSKRKIYGGELVGQVQLTPFLTLNAGFSLFDSDDSAEQYRVIAFTFVRPDGSQVDVYDEWEEPVDQGPQWLANMSVDWQIAAGKNLIISGRTGGDYDYSYGKGVMDGSYSSPLLIDVCYRQPGFFTGKDSFTLKVTNLFDRDYHQPDVYGPVDGLPIQASLVWEFTYE